jgi:uncharacterized protein (DUF433 family)
LVLNSVKSWDYRELRERIADGYTLRQFTEFYCQPEILGGIPVFRGTRVPFKNLLDYLEGGHTVDEFLEEFPSVTRQAAIAALEHAKELVIAQTR